VRPVVLVLVLVLVLVSILVLVVFMTTFAVIDNNTNVIVIARSSTSS
jgi:hypothetical protein